MVKKSPIVYRIKAKDLKVHEKNGSSWKKSKLELLDATEVAKLFKSHKNLKLIVDKKSPEFSKGSFSKEKALGERIDILPNGESLNKAYSLFAKNLKVHDEKSNIHWDVIFQNPSGNYTYLYTTEKQRLAKQKKFHSVKEFSKLLPKLKRNLSKSLGDDPMALPMLILLKTKMRIGSELYYQKNHHKGLTTLKKKSIRINGNKVTFRYFAKDGVPMTMTENFTDPIISQLKKLLIKKKSNDFIFTNSQGHPLKDLEFEKSFLRYSGKKFYPHIVRSEYATTEAEKFFKKNKKVSPKQVRELYFKIAEKLGHKKLSKKTGEWQDSYEVTIHYYVQEEIVKKIDSIVSK